MEEMVQSFYDQLSENYHLVCEDWDNSVKWHSRIIDGLIQKVKSPERQKLSLLDCSCGIGTQAIGLALLGYKVHATDLSPKEIERAEREALRLGARLTFGVADFRRLETQIAGDFDVIISCDNSLPHLLSEADIRLASKNIWSKLKQDSVFLASIRDYNRILGDRPHATTPYVYEDEKGRRIVFQVWDWEDERIYKLNQFIVKQNGEAWETTHNTTYYRAITREELTNSLEAAGFTEISWLMPDATDYHQPIVVAHKR